MIFPELSTKNKKNCDFLKKSVAKICYIRKKALSLRIEINKGQIELAATVQFGIKTMTSKRLKNGSEIAFTKATQTSTFNACRKEIKKRGYYYECNIARTGSRYLSVEANNFSFEFRFSNHTESTFALEDMLQETGEKVEMYFSDCATISIDFSLSNKKIADIRKIFDFCENFDFATLEGLTLEEAATELASKIF